VRWTARQWTSGLLVSAGVVVGGTLSSCSTANNSSQLPTLASSIESPLPSSAAAPALSKVDSPGPALLPAGEKVAGDRQAISARCLAALKAAEATLVQHNTATAVFHKRERLGGQLEEQNIMHLKVRREPHSVYMRWRQPDDGREAIWQHGANDGMILVKVDPFGSRAAEGSRRPINTTGPWALHRRILEFVHDQHTSGSGGPVTVDTQATIAGEPSEKYSFTQRDPATGRDAERVDVHFDHQWRVPVALELYSLSAAGSAAEPQLEESYIYSQLKLGAPLVDADFNHGNPQYDYFK
jgi:hypothetical protein